MSSGGYVRATFSHCRDGRFCLWGHGVVLVACVPAMSNIVFLAESSLRGCVLFPSPKVLAGQGRRLCFMAVDLAPLLLLYVLNTFSFVRLLALGWVCLVPAYTGSDSFLDFLVRPVIFPPLLCLGGAPRTFSPYYSTVPHSAAFFGLSTIVSSARRHLGALVVLQGIASQLLTLFSYSLPFLPYVVSLRCPACYRAAECIMHAVMLYRRYSSSSAPYGRGWSGICFWPTSSCLPYTSLFP